MTEQDNKSTEERLVEHLSGISFRDSNWTMNKILEFIRKEKMSFALEVLEEVNLPYPDNELLGRRVKKKINYLKKQLK